MGLLVGPEVARGRDTTLLRAILDQEAARVKGDTSTQLEVTVDLLETLGVVYSAIGQHRIGEDLLLEALKRYEARHGRENLVVARLLHRLAESWNSRARPTGRRCPCERLSRSASDCCRRSISTWRKRGASSVLFIGRNHAAQGEHLLLAALDVQRASLGNLHPDVAKTLGGLSRVTRGLSRYLEAENLARQSIEIYRQVFGVDEIENLESERELVLALDAQGRPADAEQVIRAAIERCQRLLSPAHPMNANLRLDLSHLLRRQKRLPQSEAVAREALDLAQRYEPGPGTQILLLINQLLRSQGRFDEMEQITRRQIELTRPRADEHPLMLATHLQQLTGILREQKRFSHAEVSVREALALREGPLADTKGWMTQSSRSSLGFILTQLGKYAEAEPILISANEGLTEIFREFPTRADFPLIGNYRALVDLYRQWRRPEDMERWRQRGLAFAGELRKKDAVQLADQIKADMEKAGASAPPP